MIRLTPFLKDSDSRIGITPGDHASRQSEALNRVISVLMQGIAIHGLNYDETAFNAFQDAVWKMRAGFDQVTDEDSAMLLAGSVIRLLEQHNEAGQAYARALHAQTAELMGQTLETLLDVTRAAPATVIKLRSMMGEISRAGSSSALNSVKPRLELALAEMRAKAQVPAARAPQTRTVGTEVDAITGLPDAVAAIEALAAIWPQREDRYVALFALEYLETINQRFGFRTGDQLLLQLSQQVGQQIGSPDQLFRWRGPCVAALVKRSLPESLVASEMGRVVPARIENATTVRDRDAMVRVSTSWSMLRLGDIDTLDEVIARMNEFTGNRSRFVRHVSAGA